MHYLELTVHVCDLYTGRSNEMVFDLCKCFIFSVNETKFTEINDLITI